jgi:hypothetical protein
VRNSTAGNARLERRFRLTLDFLESVLPAPARILDLGEDNELARRMRARGYEVVNTDGDLDLLPSVASVDGIDAVTAFEILEHLVAPFNVLRSVRAPQLIATIPLRLWFASAYRNPRDRWDQHFHEFEDWQFDWLLEKSGWEIDSRVKWTGPVSGIGLRPMLRRRAPRWYGVSAKRVGPAAVVEVRSERP